ncbi:MAG: CpcT/CpeT family chromophore lyase [Phycisphaerae bacterium]
MKSHSMFACVLSAGCVLAHSAAGQDAKPAETKPAETKMIEVKAQPPVGTPILIPMREEPKWSDDEAKAIGAMLAGGWKTKAPAQANGGGAATDIVLGIAPVYVIGMNNAIYVEMARADGLNRPYRHLIWRLSKVKGVWHLQSHEFRRSKGLIPSTYGLWTTPSAFPIFNADDLVATMDIPLKADGGKYSGMTPVGYATSVGGAVEMTSAITFAADRIEVADRGFDAAGKQVWGPAEGQSYVFDKADLGIKGVVNSNGLATVNYPSTLSGPEAKDGDLVTVHYIGYLENGTIFDSSYERNQPFQYAKGSKLIEGWNLSMGDVRAGMKRRIVIPSSLGYGERGSRGKVPPMATLIFDLEVLKVDAPPAAAPVPVPTAAPGAGAPKIEAAEPPPEVKAKMEADMRRRMEERAKQQPKGEQPAAPK